jgi:hypothetical protein
VHQARPLLVVEVLEAAEQVQPEPHPLQAGMC